MANDNNNNTLTFILNDKEITRKIITEIDKPGFRKEQGRWVKIANVYVPVDDLKNEYDLNADNWIKDHLK